MRGAGRFRGAAAAALIIAGILLCFNTLFAHRYSSGWDLGVILPAIIGIVFFAYAAKLLFIPGFLIKNTKVRRVICTLVVLGILFFIGIEILLVSDPYTHRAQLAGEPSYVIVLGCGIWPDGRPTLSLTNRLDRALAYYREYPGITLIVSGGKGPNEPFPEAQAMKDYLVARGVPDNQVIEENRSTSTRENFEFSRQIMEERQADSYKIVFVTNDFHVFRSRILASRFGFEAYALAAPTPSVVMLNSYLREFFALMKSMLVDYSF